MNESSSLMIFIVGICTVFGFVLYRAYSGLQWYTMIPAFLLLTVATWWLYYMIFHEKAEYVSMIFLISVLLMMVMVNAV